MIESKEREEREPVRGEGEKERPGEGAEKRKGKKGGGKGRKKIEYKEADTVSEWEVSL